MVWSSTCRTGNCDGVFARYRTVKSNPAKSGKLKIKFQREKTMKVFRFGLALALSCATWGAARAEISDSVVRVGVLNDISGIFQDTNGMGSVEAARMAAEDFNGGGKNIKVEIVYADHQNKADVGSAIVRKSMPSSTCRIRPSVFPSIRWCGIRE